MVKLAGIKPARHTIRPAKAKGYGQRAVLGVKREYILAGYSGGNIWREYDLKIYYTIHFEKYSKIYGSNCFNAA